MATLDVAFQIPAQIAAGLASGALTRNGGVIQNNTGQVVMWLKEAANSAGVTPQMASQILPGIDPTGALRLAVETGNTIATQRKLGLVSTQISQLSNLTTLATAGSMLTLGVSVLGFAVIYKKIKALEGKLKEIEESLDKIDEKIDLGFYANFRAALDLAQNAFSMADQSNRRSSALQAINRFLEAEHIYIDLVDKELDREGRISDEYLLTLCLAYLAEVRCYLELSEYDTALRRFQEGKEQIRERTIKLVNILLTENPLIYLHPDLKESIDLSRLTSIYQWQDPSLTENIVFERLRDHLPCVGPDLDDWIKALPSSIIPQTSIKKGFLGISTEGREMVLQRLPEVVGEMESVIETNQRFSSYEYEIKLLKSTQVPFSKWVQLKPPGPAIEGASLVCITPPRPLVL